MSETTAATDRPTTLFAFHHAGGSKASFLGWQRRLGSGIRLVPVQLPGRSGRDGVMPDELAELVARLDLELDPQLREPHQFYGHSMGAVVAFALASHRASRGALPPAQLLVSGYPAPHLMHELSRRRDAAGERWAGLDEQLSATLLDLGAVPATLATDPAWLAQITARLRQDLEFCLRIRPVDRPAPIGVPIHVFTGAADPLVPLDAAHAWRLHGSNGCEVEVLPGGHFFFRDSSEQFFDRLSQAVVAPAAIPVRSRAA